jgi:hypothetical protein
LAFLFIPADFSALFAKINPVCGSTPGWLFSLKLSILPDMMMKRQGSFHKMLHEKKKNLAH